MRAFIEQVAILHHLGIRVVLVHGGGPQLDEVTAKLGVQTRMVQGRRVTDATAIDATSMVLNGLINTQLLALCRELRHRRDRPRAASTAAWSRRTAARR